jgi:predicted RNA methylase
VLDQLVNGVFLVGGFCDFGGLRDCSCGPNRIDCVSGRRYIGVYAKMVFEIPIPPQVYKMRQTLQTPTVKVWGIMTSLTLFALDVPAYSVEPEPVAAPVTQKAELGQFMTPPAVARFMASLFDSDRLSDVVLLDAGAGQGALSIAFADQWGKHASTRNHLSIRAYEFDLDMIKLLKPKFRSLENDHRVETQVIEGDFIEKAVGQIRLGKHAYTHAILNPPYKKIGTGSVARKNLTMVGIETVNLYSAFVALSLEMVGPGGEVVAIIPRSFCNGPYYKSFRHFILARAAIRSIHLFGSRNKAFSDDNVLQENVIIRLQKGVAQGDVTISSSTDAGFADLESRAVPFAEIVRPKDSQHFIRIPTDESGSALADMKNYASSLAKIGVSVSTGPIVDFRVKDQLRMQPGNGDVPLLYPGHFAGGGLQWPRPNFKKPNAIAENSVTRRWLYASGFYVAVKRFSSKEEPRRIVAYLVDPAKLPASPIGFENHLNILHVNRGPLPEDVARGLVVYLNAKVVDDWFRQFNGHTQVNATDLRSLPYPDREDLISLGRWAKSHPALTGHDIDQKIGKVR